MSKFTEDRKVREGTEDPEQLLAHCDNPKIHPIKQTEAVKASIRELGWMAKIKVNLRTGDEWGSDQGVEVVIDGHDRIKAAMQEGVQKVPVEYYDLSPSEEKLFLLTYDPIGTLFVDDREMTAKLLQEANTGEEALQALLAERAEELGIVDFDPEQGSLDAEPEISRADELQAEWGTALGQVWRLPSRTEGQEHRLICGDCTEQNFSDIDMVLTDPPYGVNMDKGFTGEGGFAGKGKPIPRRQYTDDWDDSTPDDLNHLLIEGVSVVWGGNNFCDNLPLSSHWLVWDKHNTMPTYGDCELAWTNVARKSVKKYDFEYNGLIGKEKERFHPTQKPVGLFVKVLEDYSEAGQVVADFYLGSGTTLIACENLSRQCRAVEISPAYIAVALQRYKDAFGIEPELISG